MEGGSIFDSIIHLLGGFKVPRGFEKKLKEYGSIKINSLVVAREPINSNIEKVVHLATVGKIKERLQSLGHDKIVHLFIIITLQNGVMFRLEKTQTLQLEEYRPKGTPETMRVNYLSGTTNLDRFVYVSLNKRGVKHFVTYDAVTNNCQDFILQILEDNGLLTPDLRKFIKQDVKDIVLPIFGFTARIATDLAHLFDRIRGKGRSRGSKKSSLKMRSRKSPRRRLSKKSPRRSGGRYKRGVKLSKQPKELEAYRKFSKKYLEDAKKYSKKTGKKFSAARYKKDIPFAYLSNKSPKQKSNILARRSKEREKRPSRKIDSSLRFLAHRGALGPRKKLSRAEKREVDFLKESGYLRDRPRETVSESRRIEGPKRIPRSRRIEGPKSPRKPDYSLKAIGYY